MIEFLSVVLILDAKILIEAEEHCATVSAEVLEWLVDAARYRMANCWFNYLLYMIQK